MDRKEDDWIGIKKRQLKMKCVERGCLVAHTSFQDRTKLLRKAGK
jgi:hypothetical protein